MPATFRSDGIESRFTGPDPNGLFDIGHEDLAVADAPGLGRPPDRVDRPIDQFIGYHDLDLNLRQEVHDILGAAIELGVTLLPPEWRVSDRLVGYPDAIAEALNAAGAADVVLIAGKGHEDYQIVGTTKYHFSDHEVVAAALER